MKLNQCMFTSNRCYKSANKISGKPKGIIVHSTGANNKTLKRYVQPASSDPNKTSLLTDLGKNSYGNHWNNTLASKCVHAFIGENAKGEVATYQVLPFNYCCWGCGKGKKGSYNYNPTAYIQFEICEDKLTDQIYFNEAFTEAIEFCAYLCKEFGLNEEDIVSHKEACAAGYASNHGDCDHWLKNFGKNMDWFRDEVAKLLNKPIQESTSTPTISSTSYRIRVTASSLNYRSGPGTNYKVNGTIKKGGVYTIVEEKNGWGKLKSGAGWISLAYTEKIIDTPTVEVTLKVGDKVTMAKGAYVYGTTKTFSSWVYKSTLYVRAISGNKVTVSTVKTGAVTGNVDKKYLTKV